MDEHGAIDNKIKDYLAMTLHEDWKKFAFYILNDNDIKIIDIDQRGVYEKCFTMLNQWERNSKEPVTIIMVKQILEKLKRNDIWISMKDGKCNFNNNA